MQTEPNIRRTHPRDAVLSRWTAPDGLRIRRMDWPQPASARVRGSLIFAGGRGDYIEKYLEIYAHWHGMGWNVTAFDWRGQGKSAGDIVKGNVDSFDIFVADFHALIEDWRRASPGPHVAIGHSMGGHLLLRTIVDKQPPITAAVLVAPMLAINTAPLPALLAKPLVSLLCRLGRKDRPVWSLPDAAPPLGSSRQLILTRCPERYADELWWWEREPGFRLGSPSWGWVRAAYRSAAAFTPAKFGRIDMPILLLAAERDRLVDPRAIRRAAELLPQAELETFADSGHEILRETDPVRLAALARIDGFLAEHAR